MAEDSDGDFVKVSLSVQSKGEGQQNTVQRLSIADEFVIHALKAHLLAAVYTMLNISSGDQEIAHEVSAQWLQQAMSQAVDCTLILSFSYAFMHAAFIMTYSSDTRVSTIGSTGYHTFLGSEHKNYSCEAACSSSVFIASSDYDIIAYQLLHAYH